MAANKATQAALAGNNLIIVLTLVSLLAVGGAVIADKALIENIARDQKVLQAKATADKNLEDNVTNAPGLVASYQSLGDTATILSDALPTTKDFPSILVTMENMAVQSGLKLKSVVPASASSAPAANTAASSTTKPDGTPKPETLRFTVTFDSTYKALVDFMQDLELSARPMRVVSVQLSGGGAALSGELLVETFYQAKATLPITTETIK